MPSKINYLKSTGYIWPGIADLYTSELVLEEAGRGDPQAATKRLKFLENISLLVLNKEVFNLADLI